MNIQVINILDQFTQICKLTKAESILISALKKVISFMEIGYAYQISQFEILLYGNYILEDDQYILYSYLVSKLSI